MLVLYFVYGLIIGSFLNVCIYRLPMGLSLAHPRSHCPKCQHVLRGKDLIPLLSYLSVKGKCRYCGEPISIRYFLIELLCGLVFLSIGMAYALPISIVYLVWACLFIVSMFILFDGALPNAIIGAVSMSVAVLSLYPISFASVALAVLGGVLGLLRSRQSPYPYREERGYMILLMAAGLFYGLLRFSLLFILTYLAYQAVRGIMKRMGVPIITGTVRYLVFLMLGLLLLVI